MLKNTFIKLTFLSILALVLCDELYDEDSLDLDNLKITDVLKRLTLPSAEEIRHILTNEDNNTSRLPDSPKLKFILHAIEYWRNTLHDSMENETTENANNLTQVRFHLRDDFLDDNNAAYSHLSKKIHDTNTRKVNRNVESVGNSHFAKRNIPKDNKLSPLPYIYVKNFYMTENLYAEAPPLDLRKKNN